MFCFEVPPPRTVSHVVVRLVWNSLCSWDWLWLTNPPAFTTYMLGLQTCVSLSSFSLSVLWVLPVTHVIVDSLTATTVADFLKLRQYCFYSSTRFLLWFVLSSEVNYFRIMTPIFRSFPKGLSDEWSSFSSTGSINRSLSKIWLECLCGLQAKKGFCNVSCWKCGSQVVCAPALYVWRGSPKKKSRSHCSYPLPELVYFRLFFNP